MKFVQQEKPVTTKHEKLGNIEFTVECGEVETLQEMVADAGGEDSLLAFYNSARSTNAKNQARAYARNYEVAEGTKEDAHPGIVAAIATEGQRLAREYSPATDTERGPSKTKKAAAFDSVKALLESGKEFTREELAGILAAVK
jgi:hypothetical protein